MKGIPSNSKVKSLGMFKRQNGLKKWKISVGLEHDGQLQDTLLDVSNLPSLVVNSVLNNESFNVRPKGYLKTFRISLKKLTSCKIIDNKTTKFRYVDSSTGEEILIPQIELARALFFRNAYLARNCVDSGILSREFDVGIEDDKGVIFVLPHCSFPLSVFKDEATRKHLAWVLTNPIVRKSYESIADYFVKEKVARDNVTCWNFHFDPPDLENVVIQAAGWFKKEENFYLVNEIVGISGLPIDTCHEVDFKSDRFRTRQKGSGVVKEGGRSIGIEDIVVDDDREATESEDIVNIEVPMALLQFNGELITKKVLDESKHTASVIIESDTEKIFDEVAVNTGEATSNGNAFKGEYLGINNEEQQAILSRFELFKSMIAELAKQCGFEYQEYLHQLPSVGKSKLHRMSDGRPRYVMEVQFQLNGVFYSILEVDISDGVKSISTLIVKKNNPKDWDENFQEIIKKIVVGSLNWPRKLLMQKYLVSFVNHPSILTHHNEYIKTWQDRILNSLMG